MRPDFKKLLCERERNLGHNPDDVKGVIRERQRDEQQPYEDWAPGRKISLKKTSLGRSRKTKTLNENLNPLKNFLRKSVGRKWDDVYSEINSSCPNDSAVNAHIYQHLFSYVELNPLIIEGEVYMPWHLQAFYGSKKQTELRKLESSDRYPQLYVDEEGILHEAPQKPHRRTYQKEKLAERLAYERVIVPEKIWAVKLEGLWFVAKFMPIPAKVRGLPKEVTHAGPDGVPYITLHETYHVPSFDDRYISRLPKERLPANYIPYYNIRGLNEQDRYLRTFSSYYGANIYCHELKQMNSAEIRKYNLRNG